MVDLDPATTWDGVAAAWDANTDYVDAHTGPATATLVDALDVRPGDRLVEFAAGPGAMAARWSELVGPSGTVLLSDISPEMLAAATRRAAPLDNVSVGLLDLAGIDLPDGAADVALCRCGLMFVPEPERALRELHRVLAPGGRLGVMTWAGLEHNPWVSTIGIAAMVEGVLTGGPPVGPGELFSLSDPDVLTSLAAEAGFTSVNVTDADFSFRARDVDDHIDFVEKLAAPLAKAFRAATPEQVAAVRRTVAESAGPYTTDSGVAFPARALLLTTTRPPD